MYETCCEPGCCSTNVPVRDSSHAKCHCTETHLCESPVIEKQVTSCDDGCTKSTTTTIKNCDDVLQYMGDLKDAHCGHSEHDICKTMEDISKPNTNCCTPHPPTCDPCGTPHHHHDHHGHHNHCGSHHDHHCDSHEMPSYHYEDQICGTKHNSCCSVTDVQHIYHQAHRIRGHLNHGCHTYGNIKETIKEIPASNVFLVNHEFIDLIVDNIINCLPKHNMSQAVVARVEKYTSYYYVYYKDIEQVGSLVVTDLVSINNNLIADPVVAARTKAILYAVASRLEGKINAYEQ